ncbi:hypothetical protein ACUXKK_001990, partial [Klebsiella aerogenes]
GEGSRIAAHSALSGLRFGIWLVAPVSVSATGEGSRIAAHSALSGLRFGSRLVAPVSVSATGEGSRIAAHSALSGLRFGIWLVAPVSVSATGGGFPDNDASRLIRATVRYSVGSPGKRKRHRGGAGYRVRPPNLNPSRFRAGGLSACCTPRSRTAPPRADRQSVQR